MRNSNATWRNLSFIKKIKGYFTLSLLVLFIIFYAIHKSNNSFIDTGKSVEHTNQVLLQNQRILNYSYDFGKAARVYFISGKEEYLERFYDLASILPAAFVKLKTLTADNSSQQARIALMDTIITDYIEFGKKLIALRRQKGVEAVNKLVVTDFGENFMEHLNVVIDEIDKEEGRLLAIRKMTNEKSISNFSKLLVVLEVLIVSLLIVGFRVISNNTTKSNKAESDLKRNNYFISSIINNSHNPISIRDRSGKYILANNPFSKIFNVGVDEIIGKTCNDLYAKEVTDLIEETDAEILGSENTVIKEYLLSLHDGTHFYSSASFPLFDESNNIYAIASVLTDFTLINKGKEALNRSNKALQQFLNRPHCHHINGTYLPSFLQQLGSRFAKRYDSWFG